MRQQLGVSTASFLPFSATPLVGALMVKFMLVSTGFDFVQALPMRGNSAFLLKMLGVPVRYIEGAWNATTLVGHLTGEPGENNMPTKPQDVLFFPGPMIASRRVTGIQRATGAAIVMHDFDARVVLNGNVVEVHSNMAVPVIPYIVNRAREAGGRSLCIDLSHLARNARTGAKRPFGNVSQAISKLLPHTSLVHIQGVQANDWDLSKGSFLVQHLQQIRNSAHFGHIKFVVEFNPSMAGPFALVNPVHLAVVLRKRRKQLLELLD